VFVCVVDKRCSYKKKLLFHFPLVTHAERAKMKKERNKTKGQRNRSGHEERKTRASPNKRKVLRDFFFLFLVILLVCCHTHHTKRTHTHNEKKSGTSNKPPRQRYDMRS